MKGYNQVKILTVLPEFIPAESVKEMVKQVLPEMVIVNSIDFEKNDAEVLVATTFTKLDRHELSKFPNLKYIQIASTGYDNVDLQYVKEKGITLCNIPVANRQSVSEHVIAFILAFLKDIIFLNEELKERKNWPMLTGSRDLEGKTVGIVGMGAIGREIAKRLLPFGVSIVYYDVNRLSEDEEERLGVTFLGFEDLLSSSDIVTVHVPLNEKTRSMFNEGAFSKMKDGAIFINTARGEVVDENALIDAIKKKGIKAGIDVYQKEPPDFSSELFDLENVIVSPHIAGVTVESQQRFLMETISNVMRYVQGIDPLYKVIL
ncbi:MAG: 2-hydroxyacid dehydrogenase [Thermoplasmatales archaeon]